MTPDFLNTNLIILILIVLVVLLFILLIITMRITFFNNRKIKRILKNCSNGKLDEAIALYYNKVDKLSDDILQRFSELEKIESRAAAGRLKIGYLRYDAFENMSNELSYSFTILDEKDSGFVVSGIFGRDTTSNYLKPIVQGRSTIPLSDEEKRVIEYAKLNYSGKLK